MKRYAELVAVSYPHDVSVHAGDDLRALARALHIGSPYEGHRDRSDPGNFFLDVKTGQLPAIGIPPDGDGQRAKVNIIIIRQLFGQKDQAGTRSHDRQPFLDLCLERVKQIQFL